MAQAPHRARLCRGGARRVHLALLRLPCPARGGAAAHPLCARDGCAVPGLGGWLAGPLVDQRAWHAWGHGPGPQPSAVSTRTLTPATRPPCRRPADDPQWKAVTGSIAFDCNHHAVFENALDMVGGRPGGRGGSSGPHWAEPGAHSLAPTTARCLHLAPCAHSHSRPLHRRTSTTCTATRLATRRRLRSGTCRPPPTPPLSPPPLPWCAGRPLLPPLQRPLLLLPLSAVVCRCLHCCCNALISWDLRPQPALDVDWPTLPTPLLAVAQQAGVGTVGVERSARGAGHRQSHAALHQHHLLRFGKWTGVGCAWAAWEERAF